MTRMRMYTLSQHHHFGNVVKHSHVLPYIPVDRELYPLGQFIIMSCNIEGHHEVNELVRDDNNNYVIIKHQAEHFGVTL